MSTDVATGGFAVTPSDSTDYQTARALWVGASGNVAVVMSKGAAAVTLVAVPAGTLLPIQTVRVNATGTTASSIVALL